MANDSKSGSRKINQNVDLAPGARNLTTTGNITAGAFYGDGSNLTGISTAGANDALITITAGGGLTGGGGFTVDQAIDAIITVSHSDTSSQASVANTAFNVIQSITLDTYGHITAIESQDIGTAGFYVKTTGEVGTGVKIGLGSLTYQTLQFFAGSGIGVVRTDNEIQISHSDTSSAANLTASSRTYVTGLTFDTYGHVTGYTTGTETVVDTNTTYTAGGGLSLVGTVFSHTDTSSQASVNNSNGVVIQDITLDTYGHITALGSVDLDGRYYTETEVNNLLAGKLGTTAKAADSDLLDGSDSTYFDHRRYTDSSNYLGGYYVSGGTEKPNNSVFGAGKFKVAMLSGGNLGFGGSWNDVMWISTYSGGDVKSSHALVFDKYSSNVWVSDQNFDSASWGTGYLLITSANVGSQSVNYATSAGNADTLDGSHASAFQPAGSYAPAGGSYGTDWYANALYYDDWVRNHSNTNGIYWSTTGWHLHPYNSNDFTMRSGNASESTIRFANSSNTTWGYIHNDGNKTIGFLNDSRNWVSYTTTAGHHYSTGSSRAPIFYDSNNTGYYTDPASTSVLNNITFGTSTNGGTLSGNSDWGMRFTTTSGYIQFGPANSGWAHIYSDKNFYMNNALWVSGGYRVAAYSLNAESNPLYASIFYDANNTGYYVDPASTSNLNVLTLANSLTPMAPSNFWTSAITSLTNAPIYYPEANVGTSSFYLPAIHMRGRYTSGYRTHMNIGLYKYASGWGDNNTGFYVALGGNDSYPTMDWRLTYGTDIYNSNGYVSTPGSFRSPIFYDSNNTGYYVDPASTSNLNAINFETLYSNRDGNTGTIIQIDHVENSIWALNFRTSTVGNDNDSGFWVNSNGYPDMRLRREDGTVRALISSWERSYTSFGLTDSTDMRAPIFYDSNDTGYYIDPNGTSRLSNINTNDGNIELYKGQTVDLSGGAYSTSNYYPVVIGVPNSGAWIQIQNNLNSNVPSWSTHSAGFTLNLRWWTNGSGWGTTEINRRVTQYHERFTNQTICGGITQLGNSSAEIVWLRGGGIYYFKFSRNLSATAYSSTYTSNGQSVSPTSSAQNSVWNSVSGYQQVWANAIRATTDLHTPIIYDYDNTGYYVDPASTGTALNINGGISTPTMWVNQSTGNYNNYNENIRLFPAGNSVSVIAFGASGTGGIPWNSVLGYSDRFEIRQGEQWQQRNYANYVEAYGSFRAPLFYDSNNTGYYIDPAGTLRQNHMDVNTGSVGRLGINNSSSTTRYGLSLYAGYNAGEPTYGILFTGTSLGSHGSISGDWATYFTMNNDTTRGWIFRRVGSGNCASISAGGHAAFNGDVTAYYSDMRLKTKIADIENPIEKVKSLSGFIYEPNEIAESYGYEKERKVGVSAQEVQAVLPEAVKDAPIGDGYLTVQYDKLVPLLIEAIKEQQKQIEELKAIVDGLTK